MKKTEIKSKVKRVLRKASEKVKVLKGEKSVDKDFQNSKEFVSEGEAMRNFTIQKHKFLNVNHWNEFSGTENASFGLYDKDGNRTQKIRAEAGDFIQIDLPGPLPFYWVQIENIRDEEDFAEISVRPSQDPTKKDQQETVHFFKSKALSKFRFWREGRFLFASENGRREEVNNQGEEAGNKSAVNTVVATGGWAGVQDHQWNTFTKNLVG